MDNGTRSLYVGLNGSMRSSFENYTIEEPTTLKDVLEFLDKLYTSQLYKNVGEQLERDARVNGNFKEYGYYTVDYCFYTVCYYASSLRGYIEKDYKSHNKYKHLTYDKDCIDRCVVTLLKVLPKFFGTLYFLWFNIDDRYGEGWHHYGGGKWQNQTFDGSPTYWSSGTDLKSWLTKRGEGIASGPNSKATLLPGGYQEQELSSYHGYNITSSLKGLVYYSAGGGYLQYLLYYLVFAIDATPASTAVYVAFIRAFCQETETGGMFVNNMNDSVYPDLKIIGDALPEILENFAADTFSSPKASLYAVCAGSVRNLRNRLKADKFGKYVEGMRKVLNGLVTYLETMSTDSKTWKDTLLQHGEFAGPFPYGFCVTSKWETGKWTDLRDELSNKIVTLIGADDDKQSIKALKKSLLAKFTPT
ncbi:ribosome-binding protein 1 [Babesia caballi]|uniref:Ribosome-binding protein 1 n=1 Tax=Babesia caballi TaxID=5871 RepID=A0AAV4LYJ0_BABCB|nr:ribosome-binding protein 1 [Babesia caballi]